jgi:hypothetical protein
LLIFIFVLLSNMNLNSGPQSKLSSRAFKYGLISLGLIYLIGFIITAFSQGVLNNLEWDPYGLSMFVVLLFFWKILPLIPFFIVVYFIGKYLVINRELSMAVTLPVIIVLFILYGILIWGGEFFHWMQFNRTNFEFKKWLSSETRDFHVDSGSLFAVLFFVWMTFYRGNIHQGPA